jgi:hypothetical protein
MSRAETRDSETWRFGRGGDWVRGRRNRGSERAVVEGDEGGVEAGVGREERGGGVLEKEKGGGGVFLVGGVVLLNRRKRCDILRPDVSHWRTLRSERIDSKKLGMVR